MSAIRRIVIAVEFEAEPVITATETAVRRYLNRQALERELVEHVEAFGTPTWVVVSVSVVPTAHTEQ